MYPEESVQNLCSSWWEEDDGKTICPGRLCRSFVPYVTQTPLTLIPEGRPNSIEHNIAEASLEQMRIGQRRRLNLLPVAALPLNAGELYAVYKAKRRPCLILGDSWKELDQKLAKGRPIFQKTPVVTVAPFFGVEQDGSRAGFPPLFVERIRGLMYPQFFWDVLPHNGKESIMFFAHMQPVGRHHDSVELTNYKLSKEAFSLVSEWVSWYTTGQMPSGENDSLGEYRDLLQELQEPSRPA